CEQLRARNRRLFCLLSFGYLVEKNGEPVRGRIDPILEPAIPGCVIFLNLDGYLFVHGFLVSPVKRLSHAFRKLCPDVLSNEVLRPTAEQYGCLLVDVCIPPLPIEGYKSVADTLQNSAELLPVNSRQRALLP